MTKPRILVVDDYPGARYRRMRILLDDGGFEVAEESMGRDAIRRSSQERLDLLLVDLNLPDVSGLDVCRAVKGDARTAHLPVLIISAVSDRDEATSLARQAGADGFLPDTIDGPALLTAVRDALNRANRP